MTEPSSSEREQRDCVMANVLQAIRNDVKILLPGYDPEKSSASTEGALLTVGIEPNPFGGNVGPFRYQFEGEDDLLHLYVVRLDGEAIDLHHAQMIAAFLLPDVPKALIKVQAGTLSHHFFLGHDVLLD